MDTQRECGCKGCRTCLLCETKHSIYSKEPSFDENSTYVYCPLCDRAYLGWNWEDYKLHPHHNKPSIEYPGIYIQLDFLSESEEQYLLDNIENIPWELSQSGRRKQNFGPKCNFKKRRIRLGDFNGFPKCFQFVQNRFKTLDMLSDFQTIEQCSLEYDPLRGASIDPHVDDCWIWGERIVTVNLLSDSVLTMTWNQKRNKYNLDYIKNWGATYEQDLNMSNYVVRVPMPRRSLLVIYGDARYNWEHQVLRKDIKDKRICLAYREFTPPYLKSGEFYRQVEDVFTKATNFF